MKKRTKGITAFIFIMVSIMLAASGCSKSNDPIRIGLNPWPPCELWAVAEAQGYFGNLNVELVRFSTWTDNMKALPLGNIDITQSTYFNAVYYREKGNLGRIILKTDTIEGGDGLVVKNGISAISGLKGKRIAIEPNTDEHYLLYKTLERFGLGERDVVLVSTTSDKAAALFISGEVDACFTYEPYLSEAASKGDGKVVYTTKDIPDTMIDCLVASAELVKKRPSDVRKLIQAYYKAQEWVRENPEEAYALMGKNEGMSAADFGPFYESFRFFTAEENKAEFASESFNSTLENIRSFLAGHSLISSDVDIGALYWPEGF